MLCLALLCFAILCLAMFRFAMLCWDPLRSEASAVGGLQGSLGEPGALVRLREGFAMGRLGRKPPGRPRGTGGSPRLGELGVRHGIDAAH